jgi:hypothetical protein
MKSILTSIVILLIVTSRAESTTIKEMHLMCQDYERNDYNVTTKPHAYCAGYFQGQIQTSAALCKTLKILYQEKPGQRDVIMGTASLFASSATAGQYRAVISTFVAWADGKTELADKNPSIFMNEYLPIAWPCHPDVLE